MQPAPGKPAPHAGELTDEQIINGWGNLGPVVVSLRQRVTSLEAQCQRDFALAAEWKERFEAADIEARVQRDRAAAAEQQASEFKDMYEGEKLSVHQVCDRAEKAESLLELSRERRAAAEAECAALRENQEKVLQRADFFQAEHRKALDETFAVLQQRDAAESRLAAAESECAALRAALSIAQEAGEGLRAEVERLRVDERDLFSRYEMALQTCREAESSLAAATELLRRAHDTLARLGLQWVDAPVPLIGDIRAFLAAQPAAPACTEAEQRALAAVESLSQTLEYSIECGYVQHAAVRWLRAGVALLASRRLP